MNILDNHRSGTSLVIRAQHSEPQTNLNGELRCLRQ